MEIGTNTEVLVSECRSTKIRYKDDGLARMKTECKRCLGHYMHMGISGNYLIGSSEMRSIELLNQIVFFRNKAKNCIGCMRISKQYMKLLFGFMMKLDIKL